MIRFYASLLCIRGQELLVDLSDVASQPSIGHGDHDDMGDQISGERSKKCRGIALKLP